MGDSDMNKTLNLNDDNATDEKLKDENVSEANAEGDVSGDAQNKADTTATITPEQLQNLTPEMIAALQQALNNAQAAQGGSAQVKAAEPNGVNNAAQMNSAQMNQAQMNSAQMNQAQMNAAYMNYMHDQSLIDQAAKEAKLRMTCSNLSDIAMFVAFVTLLFAIFGGLKFPFLKLPFMGLFGGAMAMGIIDLCIHKNRKKENAIIAIIFASIGLLVCFFAIF